MWQRAMLCLGGWPLIGKQQWWGRFGGIALLLSYLVLAACAQPTAYATHTPAPASTLPSRVDSLPTPTDTLPVPLSSFSDWRVAYRGTDERLHVVSLDARTNIAGLALPLPGFDGEGIWTAGTSPDGQHLAYFGDAQLTIVNAVAGVQSSFLAHTGDSSLNWSPDQRYLALRGPGVVMCASVAKSTTFTAPPTSGQNMVSQPYGWLDATHVAVEYVPGSSATSVSYQSLDVTTGQLRPIAKIQVDQGGVFTVEPGGAFTLFSNSRFQNDAFVPVVDLINNANGKLTPLPQLASILPAFGGFTQVLWRPGSSQAIVATGFPQNQNLKYLLINVAQDTATSIALPGFPEAWSPDGATLIVASGSHDDNANGVGFRDVGVVGSDPFALTALSITADGSVRLSVRLTTDASTIPVLGFIRTA